MLALPQDKSSQPVIGCPSQPKSAAYDSAPSADLKRLWIVDGKSPMRIFNRREDPGLLDVRQKRGNHNDVVRVIHNLFPLDRTFWSARPRGHASVAPKHS